jgi:ferrochelatase
MKNQAVLLVNLGSPDSPTEGDVRKYLRQFLMDGRVLDAPYPIRYGIVHLAILPSRPKHSAGAYRTIWTAEGSPLVVTSKHVQRLLQARLNIPVELAMRYQNPSIESAIDRLTAQGVEELLLIPLFPHYAMSSFETAVVETGRVIQARAPGMQLLVMPPYFQEPAYISALQTMAQPTLDEGYDHVLFSYHGVPERHLRKTNPHCGGCLKSGKNCAGIDPEESRCYRAQCFRTTESLVRAAGIRRHSVAFQSRLGRDPWLTPFTDAEIKRLAGEGIKKLLVICPAFVSDCLETLEEIGQRGAESFRAAGGLELKMIPCLNENSAWIDALQVFAERWLPGATKHPAAASSTASCAG